MTAALPDVATIEEAAAYLRLKSTAVLATMARAHKIGSLKVGRQLLFPRSVIEAYIEAHTVQAAPANPFGLTDASARRIKSAGRGGTA